MLLKEHQENIVGVFRDSDGNGVYSYSFRNITNEEYCAVTKGEPASSDCCPEAAFWVSTAPFAGAGKIEWQHAQGQIVYVDRLAINQAMATKVTHDVVSDMILEDAIGKEVDVVRIKVEKQSLVATSLQECNLQIVEIDNDYVYFEADISDEAALREQEQKFEDTLITKIQTQKGTIEIHEPDTAIIKRLQNLLPYGMMQLNETFNGANFGIVMNCGGQEVHCIKQQPLEVEREYAEQLLHIQHLMIVNAYCKYIDRGFSGAYLAAPYLRQRDNGLWEAGVSHFIFPSQTNKKTSEKSFRSAYDNQFGNGATEMFIHLVECLKKSFSEADITIPKYFGLDVRSRSHLQSLAMYFMVVDSHILCLRADLREHKDVAWTILASNGIKNVYHLPTLPMTIEESDLNEAKGLN